MSGRGELAVPKDTAGQEEAWALETNRGDMCLYQRIWDDSVTHHGEL